MIRSVIAILLAFATAAATAAEPRAAYPPNPVIAAIEWAPVESIVRQAKDGDNWPVTWADDDAIYTTWGDGTGFVPNVERKLSYASVEPPGQSP